MYMYVYIYINNERWWKSLNVWGLCMGWNNHQSGSQFLRLWNLVYLVYLVCREVWFSKKASWWSVHVCPTKNITTLKSAQFFASQPYSWTLLSSWFHNVPYVSYLLFLVLSNHKKSTTLPSCRSGLIQPGWHLENHGISGRLQIGVTKPELQIGKLEKS